MLIVLKEYRSTDEDEGDDDSEKIADPVRVKSKGKEPIRPTGPIRYALEYYSTD